MNCTIFIAACVYQSRQGESQYEPRKRRIHDLDDEIDHFRQLFALLQSSSYAKSREIMHMIRSNKNQDPMPLLHHILETTSSRTLPSLAAMEVRPVLPGITTMVGEQREQDNVASILAMQAIASTSNQPTIERTPSNPPEHNPQSANWYWESGQQVFRTVPTTDSTDGFESADGEETHHVTQDGLSHSNAALQEEYQSQANSGMSKREQVMQSLEVLPDGPHRRACEIFERLRFGEDPEALYASLERNQRSGEVEIAQRDLSSYAGEIQQRRSPPAPASTFGFRGRSLRRPGRLK